VELYVQQPQDRVQALYTGGCKVRLHLGVALLRNTYFFSYRSLGEASLFPEALYQWLELVDGLKWVLHDCASREVSTNTVYGLYFHYTSYSLYYQNTGHRL
jgi:hypothetical protein